MPSGNKMNCGPMKSQGSAVSGKSSAAKGKMVAVKNNNLANLKGGKKK